MIRLGFEVRRGGSTEETISLRTGICLVAGYIGEVRHEQNFSCVWAVVLLGSGVWKTIIPKDNGTRRSQHRNHAVSQVTTLVEASETAALDVGIGVGFYFLILFALFAFALIWIWLVCLRLLEYIAADGGVSSWDHVQSS